MLYRLALAPAASFTSTPAALGLTPADVEDMLAGRFTLERCHFIEAAARGASDRLLHIQPQGNA